MRKNFIYLFAASLLLLTTLGGCGTKPSETTTEAGSSLQQTTSEPEATVNPEASTKQEDTQPSTEAESTTEETTSKQETTTEPEATTAPEVSTKPETPSKFEPPTAAILPTETVPQATMEAEDKLTLLDSVALVGNTAYEYYTYVESIAANYAKVINKTVSLVPDTTRIFNLVVPTSTGVCFPEKYVDQVPSSNQKEALNTLSKKIDKSIKQVRVMDTLLSHKDEYLYFRTDHHWTALGAYYSYVNFCTAAEFTPHKLEEYQSITFDGFLGTFYKDAGKPKALAATPDYVTAYYPLNRENLTLSITGSDGKTFHWPIVADVSNYNQSAKYGTFVGGDNPISVITRDDGVAETSCVIIKESYGNAFIPFLADHYDTVYIIDYRYWTGSLSKFVKEKGIQDVIYLNNIGMTRSSYLVGLLSKIVK